jgi:hypothetical protein
LSSPDLLADRLLQDGDPDPERVKSAAPPTASAVNGKSATLGGVHKDTVIITTTTVIITTTNEKKIEVIGQL